MRQKKNKLAPGRVRDAILDALASNATPLTVREIETHVANVLGDVPASSIRSYLRLNSPGTFVREERGVYRAVGGAIPAQRALPAIETQHAPFVSGRATLIHADCLDWLEAREDQSIHAVVTDPPYGLHEYTAAQQQKLRNGKGGVWRIPPSFDGHVRSPLPRFTTLTNDQLLDLRAFFFRWAKSLLPKLVPGANVVVASNPLLSFVVSGALSEAGLERRGELIRLVMTMRGGDRPKAAHDTFPEVSVMPRSMWEPWLLFRRPIEGRVQDNLRKWNTGGFRRPSTDRPFGDVIKSAPTHASEKKLAPHPSLKPQSLLRQIVRAALPLGVGIVLDPFAGSGSALAAAEAVGYKSIGVEKDPAYFEMACKAIPLLAKLQIR